MTDYFIRLKSLSNQARASLLFQCDNDAEASEIGNGQAVAWGRGTGSSRVEYVVETYSGREIDSATIEID